MLYKKDCIRSEKVTSKKSTYYVYYFKCVDCNTEIKAQSSQLKRHSGKCKRCTQLGEPYYFIYNELKNHKNKLVEFNLTFEEFKSLISNPICHYCGINLTYNPHSREWGKNLSRAHQFDRKDNTKGYEVNNLVTCCWSCNRLKSNIFSYEEFYMLSPILKKIQSQRKLLK